METLLIEITNKNAYNLLKELEKLNLIKVIKNASISKQKLSDRVAGKLPAADAAKLQEHIKQSRSE